MKKIIAFLLVIILSVSITACSPKEEDIIGGWESDIYTILDEYYYNAIYFFPDGRFYHTVNMYYSDYTISTIEGEWYLIDSSIMVSGEVDFTFKYNWTSKTLQSVEGGAEYSKYI